MFPTPRGTSQGQYCDTTGAEYDKSSFYPILGKTVIMHVELLEYNPKFNSVLNCSLHVVEPSGFQAANQKQY